MITDVSIIVTAQVNFWLAPNLGSESQVSLLVIIANISRLTLEQALLIPEGWRRDWVVQFLVERSRRARTHWLTLLRRLAASTERLTSLSFFIEWAQTRWFTQNFPRNVRPRLR